MTKSEMITKILNCPLWDGTKDRKYLESKPYAEVQDIYYEMENVMFEHYNN